MKRKKWIVSKGDKETATRVSQEYGIDPLAAFIVSARGYDDECYQDFFTEDAELTLDPMSIMDMDKAADRIIEALDSFEKICVYGDYDADGVTSTALLYSYLESRGANVISYIPDRIDEGYGLNKPAIKKLHDDGVKLIVTVDNGISATDEIVYAYSLGMEVVVTDHHIAGDLLPQCVAVVDPHRPDCKSSFKEMSGVGVAFKLCCAIEGDDYSVLDEYSELVALGTIGDVVSLTGENRTMVRYGIRKINENPSVGVAALVKAAGVGDKTFTSSTASFALCPRINAAGRMGSADKALELLLCEDTDLADELAAEINSMNQSRQATEMEIYKKALEIVRSNPEIKNSRIIVVAGEGWHQGVVGIVAAKLTEHYGRPSVVISVMDGEGKGSCRSVEGFSIYDAILSCSDCLTHFGGHPFAAGIGVDEDKIAEFRRRINEYAADKELPFATQRIDCKLNMSQINLGVVSSLSELEPFGTDNPQPFIGLFGVKIEDITPISEGKHTRVLVSKDGARNGIMFFNQPEKKFPYEPGDIVDIAVNLEKNVYNGDTRVSFTARGIRPAETDEEKVLACLSLYNKFSRNEAITPQQAQLLTPDRDTQVEVFRSIKQKPLKDNYSEQLCIRLKDDGTKMAKYMVTVDMMVEMGVLAIDENNRVYAPANPQKVDLQQSSVMKKLQSLQV